MKTVGLPPHVAISVTRLAEALRDEVDGFDTVVNLHLGDDEELLPHCLFGDLVRFLEERARLADATSTRQVAVVIEHELEMVAGIVPEDEWKEYFLTLLATSFFENFEPFGTDLDFSRTAFGPRLEAEYQTYLHHNRPHRV
jgi:hypothetical protein